MCTIASWSRLISLFLPQDQGNDRGISRGDVLHSYIPNGAPAQDFRCEMPGVHADVVQVHRISEGANAGTGRADD